MVKLEEPDKGRAWVVAIAACFVDLILLGLARSSPFLYVRIIETYKASREDAAQPFIVRVAVRKLAGPVVGVIGQRYGVKAATFWGGVIASLGIALCSIASNFFWLTIFWGALFGFGTGLACTLSPVLINEYFVKYRATALGIPGATIGSFVLPALTVIVLDAFGLSGSFLILAGIAMHVLPFSLLLTTPQWIENPDQYARLKMLKMKQKTGDTLEKGLPEAPPQDVEKMHIQECHGLQNNLSSQCNSPTEELCSCNIARSFKGKTEDFNLEILGNSETKKSCIKNVICSLLKTKKTLQLSSNSFSANKTSIDEESHAITTISGNLEQKRRINASAPHKKTSEVSNGMKSSLLNSIRGIGTLHTNLVFLLICVCIVIFSLVYLPLYTTIVDYGKDKGIGESNGVYIINSIMVGGLIGRMGFGWVTDKEILSIPNYIAISCILKAVFILLMPLAVNFYSFILLLLLYGTTSGTIMTHFPLLILDYVDKNLQSVAIGCVWFLSGIACFAVTPMIGYFRDNVGSYDGMFYMMGTLSAVSGCFWFLIPTLEKYQRKKDEQKEKN